MSAGLTIDPDRLETRQILQHIESIMRESLSTYPGDPRLSGTAFQNRFYETFIERVVPIFESRADPSTPAYSALRDRIKSSDHSRFGDALTQVLFQRAAVCEELTQLAHIASAHFGIRSQMVDLGTRFGGHRILRIGDRIADFNMIRRVLPESRYLKEVGGTTPYWEIDEVYVPSSPETRRLRIRE